jgi:hypothetical protein
MPTGRLHGFLVSSAIIGLLLTGVAIGLSLASLPEFRIYKLFNVIGVVWSIFGVATLSYLTAASESLQLALLRGTSFLFTCLLIQVPLGLMLAAVIGVFQQLPSARATLAAGSYLLIPGFISMLIFEHFVDPRPRWAHTTRVRIAVLGGYFVLAGLAAQLTAALFDLFDFNA